VRLSKNCSSRTCGHFCVCRWCSMLDSDSVIRIARSSVAIMDCCGSCAEVCAGSVCAASRRALRVFACAAMLLMAFAGTAAAQSVRVEGVVRDATGAAIAGAKVTISRGADSYGVDTDANGVFTLENFPHTDGSIWATASGFAGVTRTFDAAGSPTVHLEI